MLYLDYAKPVGGGYILNFFADTVEDLKEISDGKKFVTKNGTDYGVPLASSTVIITAPDKSKKTYVLNKKGEWVEGGESTKPTFIEEYNMAGMGMCITWLIRSLVDRGGINKNTYDAILQDSWFNAVPIGHGYYKNQNTPEDGNGAGESGKIVGNSEYAPLRQQFDSNKVYRVEFTPKLLPVPWGDDGSVELFEDNPEMYKRYVYVCRIISSDNVDENGPGGYMVNSDCLLTTQEEVEQFLQNVGEKEIIDGPEFMLAYNNFKTSTYTVDGNVSWIMGAWTTKECEVFILNISEA